MNDVYENRSNGTCPERETETSSFRFQLQYLYGSISISCTSLINRTLVSSFRIYNVRSRFSWPISTSFLECTTSA